MRARDSTAPPATGAAPPVRPVPAPRGTTGNPAEYSSLMVSAACAVSLGSATKLACSATRHRPSDS